MIITIQGRPASKKNSKQIGRNKYTNKLFFTSSSAYKAFEEAALWQLKQYKTRFTGIIVARYVLYQKGNYSQDFENAIASLNDVLQKAGIISDDKNIKAGSFEIISKASDWKSVIEITPLNSNEVVAV